ncbi:MAG: hypothetical protein LBF58_12495, partial [Deltaproteobacteria bacterium]|nr:hypothetical protein [Deltaproteobacteria bacterium]
IIRECQKRGVVALKGARTKRRRQFESDPPREDNDALKTAIENGRSKPLPSRIKPFGKYLALTIAKKL